MTIVLRFDSALPPMISWQYACALGLSSEQLKLGSEKHGLRGRPVSFRSEWGDLNPDLPAQHPGHNALALKECCWLGASVVMWLECCNQETQV